MLFRWFVGLNMDDVVWDVTVFTKNRDRFLKGEIAEKFFAAVLNHARESGLLSERTFHRRWDVGQGLGESQEFPAQR